MTAIFVTLHHILNFYWWIIIASAVFSWLYAFNVINSSNQFVNSLGRFFYQMTEPALSRIRRFLPNLGSIDLSPIVLLFAIMFLQLFLRTSVAPALGVHY